MNNEIKRSLKRKREESEHIGTKEIMKTIKESLSIMETMPIKEKKERLSKEAEKLLEDRREAVINKNPELFETLTKQYKKQKRKEKTEQILETLDKDLDCTDQWLGIRQLKSEYKPNPYNRKTKEGIHIHRKERANEAAKYLEKEQWVNEGNDPTKTGDDKENTAKSKKEGERERVLIKTIEETLNKDREKYKGLEWNKKPPTKAEIRAILKKFKKGKAPSPDGITTDLVKDLGEESLPELAKLIKK